MPTCSPSKAQFIHPRDDRIAPHPTTDLRQFEKSSEKVRIPSPLFLNCTCEKDFNLLETGRYEAQGSSLSNTSRGGRSLRIKRSAVFDHTPLLSAGSSLHPSPVLGVSRADRRFDPQAVGLHSDYYSLPFVSGFSATSPALPLHFTEKLSA